MDKLIEVKELRTYFYLGNQEIKAVDGISFSVERNETLAIIGESGSGKSVTSYSIMGLIDYPGKIIDGEIIFNGENLLKLNNKQLRNLRGNKISMIYQEPMTSLNPIICVGEQIKEVLLIHKKVNRKAAKDAAVSLLESVGISEAAIRYNYLPSKFSGGMRQRIMIAMALACEPELLIADEPTTALDVTIQEEIMKLLKSTKQKMEMSIILVTHDLGLVAENADRAIVMYCGKIMEEASTKELFNAPSHPYTIGLMRCIPRVDIVSEKLYSIPGSIPHPLDFAYGCRFSNRCTKASQICYENMPELLEIKDGHKVRCWFYNA